MSPYADPAARARYLAKWRAEHPDECRAYEKDYREGHRAEKREAENSRNHRNRAREMRLISASLARFEWGSAMFVAEPEVLEAQTFVFEYRGRVSVDAFFDPLPTWKHERRRLLRSSADVEAW